MIEVVIITHIAADATAVTFTTEYDTAAVVTLTGRVVEAVVVAVFVVVAALEPVVAQYGAVTVLVAQVLDIVHVIHAVCFFRRRLFAASPFARTFHVSPLG